MKNFVHVNASSVAQALSLLGPTGKTRAMAGGMDLLGEMKNDLIAPERIVNLKTIPGLSAIKYNVAAGLEVGAMATLADIEHHPIVREKFPILAQAVHSIATPQIRNVATLGGNLCQRPRCWYYRSAAFPCLRKHGNECYSVNGENKYHAILGGGPCYIVHPSDCASALIALNASITIQNAQGVRTLPLQKFFVGPDVDPYHENQLKLGEMVTRIQVPTPAPNTRSIYLKVKERGSWDFAVVAAAVVLQVEGGVCKTARVVLGGVAPIPWRSPEAEKVLIGKKIDANVAAEAGRVAVAKADPMTQNAYKVDLAANLVQRAILTVAG